MSALQTTAFTAPAPTRLLLPVPPTAQPLPRWLLVPIVIGCVGRLIGQLIHQELAWLWQPPMVLAGCVLGAWFEERVYYRHSERGGVARVALLLLQSLAWLPAFAAGGLVLLIPGVGAAGAAIAVAGSWFSSASLGSLATLVLDRALTSTNTRFRTRLMVAIFVLMLMSVVAGLFAGSVALLVVNADWSSIEAANFSIDDQKNMTGQQVAEYMRGHAPEVFASFAGLAAVIGIPSWISSAAKLADAAMYRLRPLSRAFDEIGAGKRDVRVEEAGSLDFIDLNRRFNGMVKALGDAERMEDAFGRYVSKKVLERIRAQHGQAVIPAQLRNATVFFADVRGYTALSERLEPEAVVALLNRYLAHVVELVEKHEGYLNKFIGDAVVVVFNGPVEQPDHAERAVRCAVELQAMVARENASGSFAEAGELKVGVGIATGPMVCGNVGGPSQMEYTVIGDTVNLSARLTSAAGPTEVWVSEATAQACPGLKFEALPEIKVKGKEKMLVPYKVSA